MTAPTVKVEIYFGSWVDVTSLTTETISVTRGRSRETDQFATGTASFTLRNEDRTFDPFYGGSPYVGSLLPRVPVRISCAGNYIFTGKVQDWLVNYDMPAFSTVTVSCYDGFGELASTMLEEKNVGVQLPAARISSILADANVGYSGSTNVLGFLGPVLHPATSGMSGPDGVTVDLAGLNVWMTDTNHNQVVHFDVLFNTSSTLGSFAFNGPQGIAYNPVDGHLYVCDTANNQIVKWNGSTWAVQTVWGSLLLPHGIACDQFSGEVYVVDTGNNRVWRYNGGSPVTVGFSGLTAPIGIAVGPSGNVYVCDAGNQRVVWWDGSTQHVSAWTAHGHDPFWIAVDQNEDLFISDESLIWHMSNGDQRSIDLLSLGGGEPFGVAVDNNEELWWVDHMAGELGSTEVNNYPLGTDTLDQISAMDHLNTVAFSEYAYMYMDRVNVLQFRAHSIPNSVTPTVTFTDDPTAWSTNGNAKYQSIQMLSETLLLYTQITGISTAQDAPGNRQTATSTFVSDFGHLVYQLPTLCLKNDADVQVLCNFIMNLYAIPQQRFDALSVELEALSSTTQADLTALELTDAVTVRLQPKNAKAGNVPVGPPISITQRVEGITYGLTVASGQYTVSYTFGNPLS